MAETLFDCNIRLVHMDANDIPLNVLLSKNQKEFGNTAGTEQTDPQKMPKVKKVKGIANALQQDDKLVIQMRLDTAATEAASGNAIARKYRIPVTMLNKRTGISWENTLGAGDFTQKIASAASKAHATGTWYTVDEYSIKAQQMMKLGHDIQDVRVDSALNMYLSYVA